jgi:hypothetical protein
LDEDAIRTLEEQHPDIEFDWPSLLEEAENLPPEVERRPERPRRQPVRPRDVEGGEAEVPSAEPMAEPERTEALRSAPEPEVRPSALASVRNPLLDQLVGREIASRLRARYEELATRINEVPDPDARARLQARADVVDPDRWSSAEAILDGVQNADARFEALRREM